MKQEQQQPTMGIPLALYNKKPLADDSANAPPAPFHLPPKQPFSTGLFDCFSDVELCCMTCWCPCVTFGRIAEIVDKGSSSCGLSGALYSLVWMVTGCPCVYSCTYRQKMKAQYRIMPQDCVGDFCTHCWCECCALAQEYRELQHRGYDVALGWYGNMERQETVFAPPMHGGMTR